MSYSNKNHSKIAEKIIKELGISNSETGVYIKDFIKELLEAETNQEEIKEIVKNEFGIEDEKQNAGASKKVKNVLEILLPVIFIFTLATSVAMESQMLLSLIFIAISVFCFIEKPIFSFAFLRRNDGLSRYARKKILLVISICYLALATIFGAYSYLGLEKVSPILIIIITHILIYIVIQVYVKREMISSSKAITLTSSREKNI